MQFMAPEHNKGGPYREASMIQAHWLSQLIIKWQLLQVGYHGHFSRLNEKQWILGNFETYGNDNDTWFVAFLRVQVWDRSSISEVLQT